MPRGPSKDKIKLHKVQKNVMRVVLANVAKDLVSELEELENPSKKDQIQLVVKKFKDLFQEMVGVNCTHNIYEVDCFSKSILEEIGVDLNGEEGNEEEEEEEEDEEEIDDEDFEEED